MNILTFVLPQPLCVCTHALSTLSQHALHFDAVWQESAIAGRTRSFKSWSCGARLQKRITDFVALVFRKLHLGWRRPPHQPEERRRRLVGERARDTIHVLTARASARSRR